MTYNQKFKHVGHDYLTTKEIHTRKDFKIEYEFHGAEGNDYTRYKCKKCGYIITIP